MAKPFVDLNLTSPGGPVIIAIAHITHMMAISPRESMIFLTDGKSLMVDGTLNETRQQNMAEGRIAPCEGVARL